MKASIYFSDYICQTYTLSDGSHLREEAVKKTKLRLNYIRIKFDTWQFPHPTPEKTNQPFDSLNGQCLGLQVITFGKHIQSVIVDTLREEEVF